MTYREGTKGYEKSYRKENEQIICQHIFNQQNTQITKNDTKKRYEHKKINKQTKFKQNKTHK